VDNAIAFPNTYPLESDLAGGWRYRAFEQPEPDQLFSREEWNKKM